MLTRTLAAELQGTNVRVYAVDPGDMDTQMHREAEANTGTEEADLSHLPGPAVSAPAFVYLAERETSPSRRFEAQALALPSAA